MKPKQYFQRWQKHFNAKFAVQAMEDKYGSADIVAKNNTSDIRVTGSNSG